MQAYRVHRHWPNNLLCATGAAVPASDAAAAATMATAAVAAAADPPATTFSYAAAQQPAQPAVTEAAAPVEAAGIVTAPTPVSPARPSGGPQAFMRPVTAGMIRPPPGFFGADRHPAPIGVSHLCWDEVVLPLHGSVQLVSRPASVDLRAVLWCLDATHLSILC